MSNLQKLIIKEKLPPSGLHAQLVKCGTSKSVRRKMDYKPSIWNEYFTQMENIVVDEKNVFRVYKTNKPSKIGPLLVLLHGGGYSGLTWSQFSVEICKLIHCQCISIDFRGHGDTHTENEDDLSAETLAMDIIKVISKLCQEECPILLVGHSMGGAIAVHIANMDLIPNLIGITVIDVVEGTAMEALASMQSFLRSRPTHFKSITQAVEWCLRSGQVRNLESAKVSMPGQIINCATKQLAASELCQTTEPEVEVQDANYIHPFCISEETNEETDIEEFNFKVPIIEEQLKRYTWRINLSKSEKFWAGWFNGLSEKFLNLKIPKLLLLANIDGLDKALTVGQMQGKFQMQVLTRCGHAVHEDCPHEVAEVIASFLLRNKYAQAVNDFTFHMPAC